jgi:hypothetical protein
MKDGAENYKPIIKRESFKVLKQKSNIDIGRSVQKKEDPTEILKREEADKRDNEDTNKEEELKK